MRFMKLLTPNASSLAVAAGIAGLLGVISPNVVRAQLFVVDNPGGRIAAYDPVSGAVLNTNLIGGLSSPNQLATDGNGNLFIANYASGTIGKYTLSGAPVNTSLITGLHSSGIAVDQSGNLYVANYLAGTISKYSTSGTLINASLITGLNSPYRLAVEGTDLYVSDAGNSRIGKYTTSGGTVNPALISGIHSGGLALDGQGHLYASDYLAGTVGVFTTSGTTNNASLITGLANPNGPYGIALDGSGSLYVADYYHFAVGKYTTSGATNNASFIPGFRFALDVLVVVPEPGVSLLAALGFTLFLLRGKKNPRIDYGMRPGITNGGVTNVRLGERESVGLPSSTFHHLPGPSVHLPRRGS